MHVTDGDPTTDLPGHTEQAGPKAGAGLPSGARAGAPSISVPGPPLSGPPSARVSISTRGLLQDPCPAPVPRTALLPGASAPSAGGGSHLPTRPQMATPGDSPGSGTAAHRRAVLGTWTNLETSATVTSAVPSRKPCTGRPSLPQGRSQ